MFSLFWTFLEFLSAISEFVSLFSEFSSLILGHFAVFWVFFCHFQSFLLFFLSFLHWFMNFYLWNIYAICWVFSTIFWVFLPSSEFILISFHYFYERFPWRNPCSIELLYISLNSIGSNEFRWVLLRSLEFPQEIYVYLVSFSFPSLGEKLVPKS